MKEKIRVDFKASSLYNDDGLGRCYIFTGGPKMKNDTEESVSIRARHAKEATSVYLTPGQRARLREMAEREGESAATLIRRGVEWVLREGIR